MRSTHTLPVPLFLATCACCAALAAGCATVRSMDVSGVPAFTLAELSAQPDQTVGQAVAAGPKAFVVEIKKGDRIPLELRAAIGPIALETGQDFVAFAEDLFLYVSMDPDHAALLVSRDGKRWAAAHEPGALGEVFGLGQGSLQFGFGVTKEEGPRFTLIVEKR
ncbi:MAG TPA: hypothetical protein PK668_19570 [Myxococcota bacterium]|nr:hypothetical protein [Myxococcota bacterium]HRY95068.1 hypothetical protein [Myxococcota bacterium]HSA22083.1 hypothetical protein [Myxococcota bacterium]